MRDIAGTIVIGLGLPTAPLSKVEAEAHFDWIAMFAAADITASSADPAGTGLAAGGASLLSDLKTWTWAM